MIGPEGVAVPIAEHATYLQRCVELATEALDKGNKPFGSVLVSASGEVLAEAHNTTGGGDPTGHPELYLAQWAAANLSEDERASATMYTSGEHCPMCAAAHAWCGLGPIVYASSSAQLVEWTAKAGESSPVAGLPINLVAPGVTVSGPFPEFSEQVHALQRRRFAKG